MNECKLIKGGIAIDDRGSLRFVNDFNFEGVKRFYQVQNHRRGFIRAWHGHNKEGKYVYVASGSALVGVAPINAKIGDLSVVKKFVISDASPSILWIPPANYNGFMNLEENTKVIFFSTSSLEESKGDDIRLAFDAWNIWQEDFR
jgi:dTDP-4-dehydrorhamnose 3,5-epimerase-like enzyme